MKRHALILTLALSLVFAPAAMAAVSTFDDNLLAPASHWGGAGSGEIGFISGDAWYNHYDGGSSWDGFVYSNETDTLTPGYTNQFSAITGGGGGGSSNYGLSYISTWGTNHSQIYFGYTSGQYAQVAEGFSITNTTYAYLSMLDGDGFAKKFGGTTGDDEDWFKLTIFGLDDNYARTGAFVDFYLADFRFADNQLDYILDEWAWVDLTGLGVVFGLEFELSSSDTGAWGMNTPSYFALDDFTINPVPIPGAVWLLGSGLFGLAAVRKKYMR